MGVSFVRQVQIMRLVKVYCGTCGAVFGGRLALKSHYRNSPACSADDPFTEDIKYHCRLCNEQFEMKVKVLAQFLGTTRRQSVASTLKRQLL